ncbi:MAG: PIN domain-containing protein [Thermoplasmata archaeon]|nr:PIN domain-containing protein [Candidatus Sysuiplasma acidicola]MBX8646937.1 PIN domain-containing protein [Candidatus Sysuiplasma acidicola]
MRIVVDANVLISALIKNGKSREVIVSSIFELVCRKYLGEEIYKHREYIARKSGLSTEEIILLTNLLLRRIQTIPDGIYKRKLKEAKLLMRADPGDVPYVACFLAIGCDGIWTNDNHFTGNDRLVVYNTVELLRLAEKRG